MTKRQGRGPGRVSRSDAVAGRSALASILEVGQLHPVMLTLVREADRRGITLAQLSKLTNRAPEALQRSFRTRRPQIATVQALTTALDLRPLTARALLRNLKDRDEWELIAEVRQEAVGRRAMFADAIALNKALGDTLAACSQAKRRDALAAFELARGGLGDDDVLRDAVPATAIVALCNALEFDLKPFVAAEAILETEVLEAAASLDWFMNSLPLTEHEKGALESLAARYKVDPACLVFRGALARAKNEFRRAIGHKSPP